MQCNPAFVLQLMENATHAASGVRATLPNAQVDAAATSPALPVTKSETSVAARGKKKSKTTAKVETKTTFRGQGKRVSSSPALPVTTSETIAPTKKKRKESRTTPTLPAKHRTSPIPSPAKEEISGSPPKPKRNENTKTQRRQDEQARKESEDFIQHVTGSSPRSKLRKLREGKTPEGDLQDKRTEVDDADSKSYVESDHGNVEMEENNSDKPIDISSGTEEDDKVQQLEKVKQEDEKEGNENSVTAEAESSPEPEQGSELDASNDDDSESDSDAMNVEVD
jgi:hypothetical protein